MKSSFIIETHAAVSSIVVALAGGPVLVELPRVWRSALKSEFIHKIVATYVTRVLLIVLGLVAAVVVTRILGPKGRGLYAIATTTGALGVQFGNMGMHTANVYFAARDPESLAPLVGNSLVMSLGFGGMIT